MLRPLSVSLRESLEKETAEAELNRDAVLPYLESRGVDRSTAARFRLGLAGTSSRYAGRLTIPSLGADGAVHSLRFRCIEDHDCDSDDCFSKYLGMDGVPTRLFNLRAVREASETIAIVEGELDAITLEMVGIPAVGVPGVKNWKEHHPRIFSGFPEVIVVGDNDDPGREFAKNVASRLTSARTVEWGVGAEPKEDINSRYRKHGADAVRQLLGLEGK